MPRSTHVVPSYSSAMFDPPNAIGGFGEPGIRRGMGEGVGLGRALGATHVPVSAHEQVGEDSSGNGRVFHY